VLAIHFKTGLLPPLFVSSILGFASLFEDDSTKAVINELWG
jgi:hypothetical protein